MIIQQKMRDVGTRRQRLRAWHLSGTYLWHLAFTDAFNVGLLRGLRRTTMRSRRWAGLWKLPSNIIPEANGSNELNVG